MNKNSCKKNKHLTFDDRLEIQEGLNKNLTFKEIANLLEKDPTTISKEVKLHAKPHSNGFSKIEGLCPLLLKAPFVCNGCSKRHNSGCRYTRNLYFAKNAQKEYEILLHEAREGIPLNKEEFYATEKIISESILKGQHLYHIIKANNLNVSLSTVYRHISKGYYSISKIKLPRAVKFKSRQSRGSEYVPKGIKVNRNFDDFNNYISDNPSARVVEMDTVIGRIGGKVIMTFNFIDSDFMFGLLLDNKTSCEVAAKITLFKEHLLEKGFVFGDIFPVILTDNGGEFSNVLAFENNRSNKKETSVFYCDPNSPYQKPHVENNHILLRDIVPSGTSFDEYTQDTVNLIFSHINAVKREQFNGKSAYDMFVFMFSEKLADALGITYILPKDVIQSPLLLR